MLILIMPCFCDELLYVASLGVLLRVQASTQGLVRELHARGEAAEATVLCPVPHVAAPLKEPPVVPRYVSGSCTHFHAH